MGRRRSLENQRGEKVKVKVVKVVGSAAVCATAVGENGDEEMVEKANEMATGRLWRCDCEQARERRHSRAERSRKGQVRADWLIRRIT